MATPLRAARSRQAFAATAPKAPPARALHMTGAQNQPSSYLTFQARVAELGRTTTEKQKMKKYVPTQSLLPFASPPPIKRTETRPFNTHRALQRRNDASPIDMCYFPARDAPDSLDEVLPQIPVIPLTPTSPRPSKLSDLQLGEPHTDDLHDSTARVITTSEDEGLDDGRVIAMSETDGHAHDADTGGVVGLGADKGTSELRSLLDGFMDDLLGPKRKVA